jgi:UDP:flavonoid glycosyltransferase YjiC (YdhE family)
MRVLFTVSSWPTHYASMVPLGWALQARGHEVRVLCAPSQVDPVSRAGLLPVPVLGGMEVAVHNRLTYVIEARQGRWPYPWLPLHPLTGAEMSTLDEFDLGGYRSGAQRVFAEQTRRSFDEAVRFAQWWRPDLVIHDPVSLEGLLAARVTGVPAIVSLWGPIGTHEPDLPLMPEDISDSFPRYGLGILSPDLVRYAIDPCPVGVAPPTTATRLPVRYIPYNTEGAAPEWLRDRRRRPRICVTWSTALTRMSGPHSYALPEIIRGLADLDVDLVVTATREDVAALGPTPASVRVVERCPLHLLLAGCDMVVHHGGAGSTMTALAAGVPQVAVTFASEQTRNSERMAAAGAGRYLPGHLAGPGAVRAAVAEVLTDPAYRNTATRLRDELAARPSPATLVSTLDTLVSG